MGGQGKFAFSCMGYRLVLTPLCRYIDTWDAFQECFDELEEEKMLPSTK